MKRVMAKKFTIIVGKSASGKTTLADFMTKHYGYRKYKTVTTRPMRNNETTRDYKFISKKKFFNKLDKGQFIEYNTYNVFNNGVADTWYYGTPILRNLKFNFSKYVIVLTLNGAIEFANFYGKGNCEIVYLDCSDDRRELRARFRGGFDIKEWTRRLKADNNDFPIDKVKHYCKIIDVNDKDIEEIVREIQNV